MMRFVASGEYSRSLFYIVDFVRLCHGHAKDCGLIACGLLSILIEF